MSAGRAGSAAALRGATIGFIGGGTMGQALIKGLLESGVPRRALRASDAAAATRRALAGRYGIATTTNNLDVVRRSRILVLAVKPQQMREALAGCSGAVSSRNLVISIAAGITLRWLQQQLPGAQIVRVMPNLPATVGAGFSAIAAGPRVQARERRLARAIFEAVGEVAEVPERDLDAITAVSGSGPAYVFFLIRAWEDAARRLGLSGAVASQAVRRTAAGALRLLQQDGRAAGELISRVASKGGTTEAALKVLERRRVHESLVRAIEAAAKRSKALTRGR
jgi:pyrroline-5-carboxylate reductase